MFDLNFHCKIIAVEIDVFSFVVAGDMERKRKLLSKVSWDSLKSSVDIYVFVVWRLNVVVLFQVVYVFLFEYVYLVYFVEQTHFKE